MSISISYDATYYSDWSVADYLADWTAYFGSVGYPFSAGAFSPGLFDGSQYALKSADSDAAFIAGGDLHYPMWGRLDSLSLGQTLTGGPSSGGYTLENQEVSFNNLGLSSPSSQGRDGVVNKVIYGLMSGDSGALQEQVDALLKAVDPSLSVHSTFDQLAAAGIAHASQEKSAAADIVVVGVQELPHDLALAA